MDSLSPSSGGKAAGSALASTKIRPSIGNDAIRCLPVVGSPTTGYFNKILKGLQIFGG